MPRSRVQKAKSAPVTAKRLRSPVDWRRAWSMASCWAVTTSPSRTMVVPRAMRSTTGSTEAIASWRRSSVRSWL